jgi:beta-phosphoglucomutase
MPAIEDSPTGIWAARNADLHCIAFATPFTEKRLREESPLDDRWIVSDPNNLLDTVDTLLAETA